MSHSPQNPSFFDTIQVYFLEVTGRGIMFGGRDLELLSQWRDEGASAKVICRGIKEAVDSKEDGDPPRNIYACRGYIEAAIEGARERSAGAHGGHAAPAPSSGETQSGETQSSQTQPSQTQPSQTRPAQTSTSSGQTSDSKSSGNAYTSLFEEALTNIERAGKKCDAEELRKVYREAWRELKALADATEVDDPFSELAAIEDALVDGYFRALDRAEQDRIEDAISEQNRADLAIMSPEARREHLAARRRRLLIRDYDFVPLID